MVPTITSDVEGITGPSIETDVYGILFEPDPSSKHVIH